jgi:hypothetical protein
MVARTADALVEFDQYLRLEVRMRKLSLLALIAFSLLLSGCSFSTPLAVINLSDKPVEVTYQFKDSPGSFHHDPPKTKPVAALGDDDTAWLEVPAAEYVVNSYGRAITLTLAPKTAVVIDRVRGPGIPDEASFRLSDVVVRGAYGTIMLHGRQVRKAFVEEDRVYAISYR